VSIFIVNYLFVIAPESDSASCHSLDWKSQPPPPRGFWGRLAGGRSSRKGNFLGLAMAGRILCYRRLSFCKIGRKGFPKPNAAFRVEGTGMTESANSKRLGDLGSNAARGCERHGVMRTNGHRPAGKLAGLERQAYHHQPFARPTQTGPEDQAKGRRRSPSERS